jgi:CHAD domain-containing protein
MGDSYLERERKLDVLPDFAFPQLQNERSQAHELRAVYYDTDDALLQARDVTLRRRTGGDDDGWHLKVPDPQGRLELRADVESPRPPRDLMQLSRGLRFDQPLHRTVVLTTVREAHQICSNDGELVAEVADDRVTALVGSTGDRRRWREIEIELGPAGSEESMERLADALRGSGATPSTVGSKYARAVGEATRARSSGLAGVVDDYLQRQYDALAFGDLHMRRGDNAVHKTRVAVRRVRSTLRIFAALFDQDRAARLDGELRWYAELLGAVRDLDIARRRLEEDLEGGAVELVPRQVAARLLGCLEGERAHAWERVLGVLEGRRYGSLLRELASWRRETPWTAAADDDPDTVKTFVKRARKKSDKRLRQAECADPDAVDEAFHRARKAAKRTRYAAELARPVVGKRAKKIAREHEQRQDRLGIGQDHRMLAALLQRLADREATAPDVAFACGALAQRHRAALEASR